MKLWHCDWVPSSVADWLCRELDEKGIAGTKYTHTLFSLLHPYFCPHPVPPQHPGNLATKHRIEDLQSVLQSAHVKGLEGLYEELQDYIHPDADFPHLIITEKKEGSRRSKKRQKKNLQNQTPEKLWKIAALQCLLTASDEYEELKSIVEELFLKLKAEITTNLEKENSSISLSNNSGVSCLSDCLENHSSPTTSDPYISSCFDFPPLAHLAENIGLRKEEVIDWKRLIKDKLSPKEKDLNLAHNSLSESGKSISDVRRNLEHSFKEVELKNKMDVTAGNNLLENKTSCFVPILADSLNLYASDKTGLDNFSSVSKNTFIKSENPSQENTASMNDKLEEWECAGDVFASTRNRTKSIDILGNRLFERSLLSLDTSCGANGNDYQDPDTFNIQNEIQSQGEVSHSLKDGLLCLSDNVWNSSNSSDYPNISSVPAGFNSLNSVQEHSQHLKSIESQENNSAENHSTIVQSDKLPWPPNKKWESLSLINPNNDPLFGSTFQESSDKSCRNATGENCRVSLADISSDTIWSDCNDNVSFGNSLHDGSLINDFENKRVRNNITEENLCESFKNLGLEHLWTESQLPGFRNEKFLSRSFTNAEMSFFEDNYLNFKSQQILSKCEEESTNGKEEDTVFPSIPSGPSGPYVELKHTETSGFSTVVPHKLDDKDILLTPKGSKISLLTPDQHISQEEENLLTSPRTHFKPIRQDSQGSILEDKTGGGPGIKNDSDLVFHRTDSGNLFLESDLLEGSPKKYMIYREPSTKLVSAVDALNTQGMRFPQTGVDSQNNASSIIPKFKIINNEKFCQTEEEFIAIMGKKFDENVLSHNFIKENSHELSWKNKYPKFFKLLWEDESKTAHKEAWEIDLPSPNIPKWFTDDVKWSTGSDASHISDDGMKWKTDIPHSEIFHSDTEETNDEEEKNALSKIKSIWLDETPEQLDYGSRSPPSFSLENLNLDKNVSFSDSWNNLNQVCEDNDMNSRKSHRLNVSENPWNVNHLKNESSEECIGTSVKEKLEQPPLWQLQWEVDQEADEILGGLMPSSPLKASPPIKEQTEPEFNFLDYLDAPEYQPPVEDLENLEPGWDLNDGFEWGPVTEEGDDEDGRREVLIYENEDGQTVMVPVEYLDDTLYDEIFGSDVSTPFGGSMPDLPHDQIDWKKFSRRNKEGRCMPPSRRPCSFFLEGNCRRSDCKFSHDLLTITCRFWEEGSCLKGDTCPFRHAFVPPPRRRNRSEGDQVNNGNSHKETGFKASKSRPIPRRQDGSTASINSYELDSETDFPCLGSSVESKNSSLDEQNFPANVKVVSKVSKKKKKFIAVTKTIFKDSENDLKAGKLSKGGAVHCKHKQSKKQAGNSSQEKGDSKKNECQSLRKILRKRANTLPSYSHEDGTVSDF